MNQYNQDTIPEYSWEEVRRSLSIATEIRRRAGKSIHDGDRMVINSYLDWIRKLGPVAWTIHYGYIAILADALHLANESVPMPKKEEGDGATPNS